jgi:hypothetical protein
VKPFVSQTLHISALCLLLVASAGACHEKKVFREHTVRRQDEAAAVSISATLVAHWDDYVSVLGPKFEMKSGDEALKKVIPQTMAMDEKVLRMFGASLGITARDYEIERTDADQSESDDATLTKTTTSDEDEGEQAEEGEEEKADDEEADEDDEETRAETSDESEEQAGASARPSARDLPGLSDEQLKVSQDPMLEYLAATALYQEVQLLNRYIQDAALRRDYKPYVVRLQIGVTPYARNMPYDVYATLAFFGDRPGKPERLPIDTARRPAEPSTHRGVAARRRQEHPQSLTPVLVTPLLVTDNLEGALKSRAVNTIRDFVLALSVLTGKVDVDSKLTAYTDKLSRVLGTDLNSLFTVSQVNDNSVRVRLGAARQATSGHAMIPRTHNVTLLVLVPNELNSRRLRVEAATELRHATNGEALDIPSPKSRRKEIQKKLKRYSKYVYSDSPEWAHYCYEGLKSFLLYEYDVWTASSDFTSFEQALYTACETTTASANLWMELVELSGNRPYARASFELPEPRAPRLPEAFDEQLILRDDKKSGKMTVTLHGGRDLIGSDLFATLELRVRREKQLTIVKTSGRKVVVSTVGTTYGTFPLRLASTDIAVGRGYIKLTFPSLAKEELGTPLLDPSVEAGISAPKLTIRLVEDSRWKDDREPDCGNELNRSEPDRPSYDRAESKSPDHVACRTYEHVSYILRETQTPAPQFRMSSGVDIIRSDGAGKGELSLHLSTTATEEIEVKLEISGAQVKEIRDTTEVGEKGKPLKSLRVKIKKDQSKDLTVELANLSTRSLVTVNAKVINDGKEGFAHAPVKFWVEPLPRYRTTGSK